MEQSGLALSRYPVIPLSKSPVLSVEFQPNMLARWTSDACENQADMTFRLQLRQKMPEVAAPSRNLPRTPSRSTRNRRRIAIVVIGVAGVISLIMMFVPWLSPSERRFVGTWTMTGTGDPNPVDVVVRSDRIMVLTFSSGDTAKYHWEIVDDKLRVTQMDPVWRVIKKQIEATFLGRKPFTHQTDSFTWGENGDGGFCFENNMRTSFDWTPDVD